MTQKKRKKEKKRGYIALKMYINILFCHAVHVLNNTYEINKQQYNSTSKGKINATKHENKNKWRNSRLQQQGKQYAQ